MRMQCFRDKRTYCRLQIVESWLQRPLKKGTPKIVGNPISMTAAVRWRLKGSGLACASLEHLNISGFRVEEFGEDLRFRGLRARVYRV